MQGCLVLAECLSVTDTRSCILRWQSQPSSLCSDDEARHVSTFPFTFDHHLPVTFDSHGLRSDVADNRTAKPKDSPNLTHSSSPSVFSSVVVSGDPEKEGGMVNKCGYPREVCVCLSVCYVCLLRKEELK